MGKLLCFLFDHKILVAPWRSTALGYVRKISCVRCGKFFADQLSHYVDQPPDYR